VKVVFLEEVEGSGRIGDIKEVANGFARNYLLPRRLAAAATPAEIRRGEALAEKEARRQAVLDEEASGVAEKLTGALITISARVGEQGRLYGSITAADIAEEVSRLAGRQIEHRQVLLAEPLKELGTQEISIRLTRNVETSVQVEVASEEPPIEAEPAAEAQAEQETEVEAEAVSEAEAQEEAEPEPETEATLEAEEQEEAEAEPETKADAAAVAETEGEQESLKEEREPDG
jgi:large subunit ribosomal protein L9